MHIKYGCIKCDDYYVIKIASGFYENHRLNLPNFKGNAHHSHGFRYV